jgi:murein L,D-transpeptidase YafK
MKKWINIALLMTITIPALAQNSFKKDQLKFERVKDAYAEKGTSLQKELKRAGFTSSFELYIAAYKTEGKLELWLKAVGKNQFELFKTYDFCKHSGTIGPKVIEGDGQTPEGFYKINVFNPQSNFHLSLGINYPNKVDLVRTGKGNRPGSDIYIHGDCVTIGCIPLTDDKIKEVYLIAVEARNNGQKEIPVSIFPFKLTQSNLKKYGAQFPAQLTFWQTLQVGYAYFEKNKILPKVSQEKGSYIVK